MKSFKLFLVLLIGMIAFTNVSCSSDNEQKETTTQTLNKEGDDFSFSYYDENDNLITETYTWKQYTVGQQELPASQSLLQGTTVTAGAANAVCRILCAKLHHCRTGYYYTGYLIDYETGALIRFYYAPAQQNPQTGIDERPHLIQVEAPPGSGC